MERNVFVPMLMSVVYSLQVLLESDIIHLVGKYSVLENFSGQNTFSKIVALMYKRAESDLRLTKKNFVLRIFAFVHCAVQTMQNSHTKFKP